MVRLNSLTILNFHAFYVSVAKKYFENEALAILLQLQPCCPLYFVALRVRLHQVYFTKYSNSFVAKNLNLRKNIG